MTAPTPPSPSRLSIIPFGVAFLSLAIGVAAPARAERPQKTPQTSAEANSESLGSAVVAPLRDINLVRSDIPDLLKRAAADPYAPPGTGCAPLRAEIEQLDAVLGDDYDEPRGDGKNGETLSRPVLGVVASTLTEAIPLRGWVRRLSGADRHDQQVRDVIKAGFVRRGYLKGLQRAGACGDGDVIVVAARPALAAAPLSPLTGLVRVAQVADTHAPAAAGPVP